MVSRSWTTLAAGARQFVVQLALLMMWWIAGSYRSSLTPRTIVMSSSLAGALMMTFFAPASMCAPALAASVKMPVLSRTMSTPRSPHGRFGRVALGEDLDLVAVDDDRRVAGPDVARVRAVGRVALEQEGVHLGVDEVVDRDDLDVRGALDEGLERLATDPAEAVDADAGGHGADLLGEMPPGPGAGRNMGDQSVRADRTGCREGSAGPPGSSVEAIVPKGRSPPPVRSPGTRAVGPDMARPPPSAGVVS